MLTGRTVSAAPGLVFYDAWQIAADRTSCRTRSRLVRENESDR